MTITSLFLISIKIIKATAEDWNAPISENTSDNKIRSPIFGKRISRTGQTLTRRKTSLKT